MANFEIVPYEQHHHSDVLQLQQRLWGQSLELNRDYFRWKYVDNPHAQFGRIFLAVSGSRIVGMRGFMGSLWRDPHGNRVPIPLAGDTVVAEDYEGRGIVNRLSRAARRDFADRGINLILSTSASPVPFLLSLRSGWKVVGHYTLIRSHSRRYLISKLAQSLRRVGFLPAPKPSDAFVVRDGWTWNADEGIEISLSRAVDPESLSNLCAAVAYSSKYSLIRDVAFFRWRFNNPLFKYYFLTCGKHGALAAYLCLRVQVRKHGPDVRIVDWNGLEWRFVQILLQALGRRIASVPVSMLANGLTAAEQRDLLNAGYRNAVQRSSRVARRLKVKPGLLVIATASDGRLDSPVPELVANGFDLIEYKGIESDGD